MKRSLASCGLWILIWSLAAAGQARGANATLKGTVQDESGAVVAGATVTATDARAERSSAVVTDAQGRFELSIEGGAYEIEVALSGFRPEVVNVAVAEGEVRKLDVVLAIAPLTETVTVTRAGQRLSDVPNAVTVVEREEIQFAQRRVSPEEFLSGIPGLLVANRRNFSLTGGVRLSIRAPLSPSGMRGLQLIQDGIPLTTADGTTQPTNLELGSAGQVEIIRGPSAVLYGNSAGGVISVRTEFPPANRLRIEPDLQFGSYGYRRQQVKAEGTSGPFGYVMNVSRMETDGFRRHSGAEIRQANFVVRDALSPNTEIRGVFNFFDMPFGESASTLNRQDALNNPRSVRQAALDEGWGESSRQGQGGLTLEHHFAGGRVFSATGWATTRSVWNPIPARIVDLGRVAAGFRSVYGGKSRLGTRPVEWTAGFDLSYQRDDRSEFRNAGVAASGGRTREGRRLLNQLEQVMSVAPFGQVSLAIAPRWRLTAGARYDYYDFNAGDRFLVDGNQSGGRTMNAASPVVGLTYAATGKLDVYGNFGTAYQTPTTQELSNRPTGEGGFNEDLGPATTRSFEVGARGVLEPWRLHYVVAAYVSRLDHAFVAFQRPDEQTYFRNAGESSRRGAEVLLEWMPVSRLKGRLAYTYRDFTFRRFATAAGDYSGKNEPGTPPHQLFVGGSHQADCGITSIVQIRWVDAYAVNNANTAFNWSSHVVDLRFGFNRKWKHFDVRPFLGVDNVFAERYNASSTLNAAGSRFYEPAPGRELYVGVTIGAGL